MSAGTDAFEIPEIITVLDGDQINTDDRVYIYRELPVVSEWIIIPTGGTNNFVLINGPVLFIRSILIHVTKPGPIYEQWTVSNAKITTVFQGNFPDPNNPSAPFLHPQIYLSEKLLDTWTATVNYSYAYDYQEFSEFTGFNHESGNDTNADALTLDIADIEGKYNPGSTSAENMKELFSPQFGGFESWVTVGGIGTFEGWQYPTPTPDVYLPDTVVFYEGTQSMKIKRTLSPNWTMLTGGIPLAYGRAINISLQVSLSTSLIKNFTIHVEEYDYASILIRTTQYDTAIPVGPHWYTVSHDHTVSDGTSGLAYCYYIRIKLEGTYGDFWNVDAFSVKVLEPLFDYMKVAELWSGMKDSTGDMVYDKRGRFYIDKVNPGVSNGVPSLQVTCFSNLGRLNFSRIQQSYYARTEQDGLDVPGYTETIKAVVYEAYEPDTYKSTVWRKPTSDDSYFPIADWETVVVWGLAVGDGSAILVGINFDFVLGHWVITPVYATPGDPRAFKRIDPSEYTVDNERGWIIFKKPMANCLVSADFIVEGTNEIEDIITKILLVPSDPLVDPSIYNFDDVTRSEFYMQECALDGGGPGFTIDEVTDYNSQEVFSEFGDPISVAGVDVQLFQSPLNHNYGYPTNNFVLPSDELDANPDIVSPNLTPTGSGWILGHSYTVGPPASIVNNRNVSYTCKFTHTSAADNEPGVGIYWTTYWSINQFIGIYIELYSASGWFSVGWHYIQDLIDTGWLSWSDVYVDYKGGFLGLNNLLWTTLKTNGITHLRASYRYWTLQWSQSTANKFEWLLTDGTVADALSKIRENLLDENYLFWDDKDGKIRGSYINEKAMGQEDFWVRMQYSLVYSDTQRDIVTKVVSIGATPTPPEPPFGAWVLKEDYWSDMNNPLDPGTLERGMCFDRTYMGTYKTAVFSDPIAYPTLVIQRGQPATPLYDSKDETVVAWGTNNGFTCDTAYCPAMIGIDLLGIKRISKIAFNQAYSGCNGDGATGGWIQNPKYTIEYLDTDALDYSSFSGNKDFWIQRQCGIPQDGPSHTGTGGWKDITRTLTQNEINYFAWNSVWPADVSMYPNFPWKLLSSKATEFDGGQAGNWIEIDDLPTNFRCQYLRIRFISGGSFRSGTGTGDDLQWNLNQIKFIADDTMYGVAMVRDFSAPNAGWIIGHSYVVNDMVLHNGSNYKCKSNHAASAGYPSNEPGTTSTGNIWRTYWTDLGDPYNDPNGEFYNPMLLTRLYPNSYRTLVMPKDTGLTTVDMLKQVARTNLSAYLKIPVSLSVQCVFGFFRKNQTVRVFDSTLNQNQNFLVNKVTYSKQGVSPSVSLEITHRP